MRGPERRQLRFVDGAVTLLLIMALHEWWGWAWYAAWGFVLGAEAVLYAIDYRNERKGVYS
jgi:hypothetical protein